MATKTTSKQPSTSAGAKPGKAAKSAKPETGKLAKPTPAPAKPAKPPTTKIVKAAAKAEARPGTAKVVRPGKAERPARHEKPGTGRVIRSAGIERPRSSEARIERRSAPPVSVPASNLACPFPKAELAEWRRTLIEHRLEISQDIQHLEQGAMEAEDGHTTPNHLAERGSDAEMQDMSLGLAGEEQIVIWQIDRALRKIDNGGPVPFGLCEHTKQAIPKTRLQLIPWTPVSIEGMNYVEENGLALEDVLVDG
jgi:RNA polymerase-binding transcription factor DksA